jgi:hypothetical protein
MSRRDMCHPLPSNVVRGPLPHEPEWDRREHQATPARDYGGPQWRDLRTIDPREALVFLGIVGVALLASIIGIHP